MKQPLTIKYVYVETSKAMTFIWGEKIINLIRF